MAVTGNSSGKSFTIDHILHGAAAAAAAVGRISCCSSSTLNVDQRHKRPVESTANQLTPIATPPWIISNYQHHYSPLPLSPPWLVPLRQQHPAASSSHPWLVSYYTHWNHPIEQLYRPNNPHPLPCTRLQHGRLNIQNAGEASSPDAEAAEAAATVLPSRLNRRHGRKGGQIRFTQQQSSQLEETFASQRYLTPGQRRSLANRLALTERQVKTWFQNRRAKWRRSSKDKIESTTEERDSEESESEPAILVN